MVASMNVLELAEAPETDPALFHPPENAVHWATCDKAQDRELIASSPPIYPSEAKTKFEQGRVIFYAVIEGESSVSHTKLIQAATPVLDAVTLAALNQWRYKAATCGQTPVRTETSIAMDFWLGG
jgi:outer membrane biosynthesis protein TonB